MSSRIVLHQTKLSRRRRDFFHRYVYSPHDCHTNLYVQIAILYEVHNWDNGWWLWQNNWYYHNIGIYTFHTTSL